MDDSTLGCTACQVREWILARVLAALKERGYPPEAMRFGQVFEWEPVAGPVLRIGVELVVSLEARPVLLVKCLAGNLVTRERATVAVARLFFRPPVPLVMVANDTDAVVIETRTGKTTGFGYASIPDIETLRQKIGTAASAVLTAEQLEREKRILDTYLNLGCGEAGEAF